MTAIKLFFKGLPIIWGGLSALKQFAIIAAALVVLMGACKLRDRGIYNDGYKAGENNVQDKWNEAVAAEIKDGEKAGEDAARDVKRAGPGGMLDDSWNRDVKRKSGR